MTTATMNGTTYRCPLGAVPTAPKLARQFIRTLAAKWGIADLEVAADLETLISELTTNALLATGRDDGPAEALPDETVPLIEVRATALPTEITISVWDNSPFEPTPTDADEDAENGRGLIIVKALATAWGYTPETMPPRESPGKIVWAKVAVSLPTPAPALPPQRTLPLMPPLPRRPKPIPNPATT